jgi:hypothetical protein
MNIMLFSPHEKFAFQLTHTLSTLQYVYILGRGMRLKKLSVIVLIQVILKENFPIFKSKFVFLYDSSTVIFNLMSFCLRSFKTQ